MQKKFLASMLFGLVLPGGVEAQGNAPPGPVMIFFDWGKSSIDRDYAVTLEAAVAKDARATSDTVLVEGHSDRSGNSAANRRASLVRAAAVREFLIAKGVSASRIRTIGWGEDRPLIATADGVREPQNRRVDVFFETRRR